MEPANPECDQIGANRRPDAVDDELRTRPGRTVRANVLGNDVDPDGDALTVRPDRGRTSEGTLEVAADGAFSYTPPRGFVGRDGVGYTVTDGRGGSDVGMAWLRAAPRTRWRPRSRSPR